jgi:hypothetical protein
MNPVPLTVRVKAAPPALVNAGEMLPATGAGFAGSAFTTWLKELDVLAAKFESPLYAAVMVSVPCGSAVVVKPAELPVRDALPRLVLPLLNVMVPVTVPPNCPETVAVKVTDWPELEGFGEEVNVVLELAFPTTWLTAGDVLPEKSESPPYTAVIESVPAGSAVVVRLAAPLLRVPVPKAVEPLMNVTFSPLGGVPLLEETVAPRVTGSPNNEGFGAGAGESAVVVAVSAGV